MALAPRSISGRYIWCNSKMNGNNKTYIRSKQPKVCPSKSHKIMQLFRTTEERHPALQTGCASTTTSRGERAETFVERICFWWSEASLCAHSTVLLHPYGYSIRCWDRPALMGYGLQGSPCDLVEWWISPKIGWDQLPKPLTEVDLFQPKNQLLQNQGQNGTGILWKGWRMADPHVSYW